jgi:hypothetical protein
MVRQSRMMYFHSCDARNIVARSFNLVFALTVHCDLRLLLHTAWDELA